MKARALTLTAQAHPNPQGPMATAKKRSAVKKSAPALQLPKGTSVETKVMEQDNRIDDHASRIGSLEQRFGDFFNYAHGAFTRGNLHPPTPSDPEHDNATGEVSFKCVNAPIYRTLENGDNVQVGGCGAESKRTYAVNRETVPGEITCAACGGIAKRVDAK